MQLWKLRSRLRRDISNPQEHEDVARIAGLTNEALSHAIEPRSHLAVGNLLACLWQEDVTVLSIVRAALVSLASHGVTLPHNGKQIRLNSDLLLLAATPNPAGTWSTEAHYMQELADFIRHRTPQCPETAEARYDAVIMGLRASMLHNMKELVQTDEIFPIDYLFDSLHICSMLRADELHDVQCEMLVAAHTVIIADRDGPRIASLENLRRKLRDILCYHPEHKPVLWEMLKDPQTSEEFWSVVDLMDEGQYPPMVPLLLDALAALSEEGKAHVIRVLQNTWDVRAVPALQELAQDRASRLAPLAQKAIKHILRHSTEDAVQLLRPGDSPPPAPAGESLLRPVEAAADRTHPDELLRPLNLSE